MTRLLQQLSESGYKITPQRRLILEVLQESNRHLTANEIAERVKTIQPSVSVATIYRNLNLLVEAGLIGRLDLTEGPARFELFKGHNHYMLCLGCGRTIKLDCPMEGKIQRIIEANNFEVASHHFEITGYCKYCQAKKCNHKEDK